jgi:hypothetical protein
VVVGFRTVAVASASGQYDEEEGEGSGRTPEAGKDGRPFAGEQRDLYETQARLGKQEVDQVEERGLATTWE